MKLIKDLKVVEDGEIYPTTYPKGDTCPKHHIALAKELGCVRESKNKKTDDSQTPADNQHHD